MPIRSSTKMAGPTSRYLKLRSVNPGRACAADEATSMPCRLRVPEKRGAPIIGAPRFRLPLPAGPVQRRIGLPIAVRSEAASLLRVGARLRRPGGVHRLLLVHADLLRDLVPLLRGVVEDLRRIVARPQPAERLAQRFLVLVGLDQRQVKKPGLGRVLQRG